MGENIADLGGLPLALDAYHASLDGKPAPVIDGLTGDQRFFLGWAQVWREKTRDDALRSQVTTDPHSPDRSVFGPVRNVQALVRCVRDPARQRDVHPAGEARQSASASVRNEGSRFWAAPLFLFAAPKMSPTMTHCRR